MTKVESRFQCYFDLSWFIISRYSTDANNGSFMSGVVSPQSYLKNLITRFILLT